MNTAQPDNLAEYRKKLHSLLCTTTTGPAPNRVYSQSKPVINKNVKFETNTKDLKIQELQNTIESKNEKILKLSKLNTNKDEQLKKLGEKIKYLQLAHENKDLKIKQLENMVNDLRSQVGILKEEKVEAAANGFIEDSFVDESSIIMQHTDENTQNLELNTERLMNLDLQNLSFDSNDHTDALINSRHSDINHIDIYNTNPVEDSDDNSDLENYLFEI